MPTLQFICANWNPDSTDCKKAGGFSCKNCYLVVYCGSNCQKSHWSLHKIDCKSPVSKGTWAPGWVLEDRTPDFVGGGIGVQFGGKKFLWGNIPALDVLQLGSNEGDDYKKQLSLLFAASGDIRNVVKTIGHLPSSYSQFVDVTMNDRDIDIVARNAIILLIALVVDDIDEAIDCIIHVWYSVLIRKSDLSILQQRVRPLVENVCEKIQGKPPHILLGKTWTFGQRSLRLVLERSAWDCLLLSMSIPEGVTAEKANQIRTTITLAESRKDYRDRHLFFQSPSRRIAINRFLGDGLLLPFGSQRHDFQEPNPTLFQTTDSWLMKDNADPLNGWSLSEVENCSSGPAAADIYGKIFYYLRAVLRTFLGRLASLQHLEGGTFSRIEVSNISDGGYLGIHSTIGLMVPFLQGPLVNPHASLITLFMNAVDEAMTEQDTLASMAPHNPTTQRLYKYLPSRGRLTSPFDPELIRVSFARDIVGTYDHIFDRYAKHLRFSEVAQLLGATMKEKHSIIEKWPFKLKLRPGQPGAQEEFDRLLSGGVSGKERYVEWKRVCI